MRAQDDPFHHVNGGSIARTEIPADKSSYGSFDILIDKSQSDLRAIIEEASTATNRSPGSEAQKIGDFYASFMNEARVEEIGLRPLDAEFAAIDRLQTKTDLARYFARMFKLNLINPLVGFVDGDAQQPDREILYVYQGRLGSPTPQRFWSRSRARQVAHDLNPIVSARRPRAHRRPCSYLCNLCDLWFRKSRRQRCRTDGCRRSANHVAASADAAPSCRG